MTGKNANFGQIYELLRFYDFRKAAAIAFLGILKIITVNFLLFVQKLCFFDDKNLCHEKLDLGQTLKLKDFLAMLACVYIHMEQV